ncbi:hypothetical protein [Deminuibacter soli]|uniref:DUF5675 domain-containing protein n=1 Tax=Deminuibacter soli TaxID=2291815 RepID=A0A3E1NCK9_9BACT|nr:hypothetical protein [Deminuibacter soli]RFM25592.1 hypothetical protein DXN05_24245 [Deminuibacter soli]
MLNNLDNQPAEEPKMQLHIRRTLENSAHTYGSFTLDDAGNTEQSLSGYSIEPGGLSGPVHLSGKRLPAGVYRLAWEQVAGEGNRLVLYNSLISKSRQVVLGNTGALPEGSTYLVLLQAPGYTAGSGASMHDARALQHRLEARLKTAGVDQVEVHIHDN